jgi:hypothetical protein
MKHMLLRYKSVYIHVRNDLQHTTKNVLPITLVNKQEVILCWGLDLPVPIPDLHVDDVGISGTLSFSGKPHFCVLRWENVYAIVGEDGKGVVYQELLPVPQKQNHENVRDIRSIQKTGTGYRHQSKPGASRTHLRCVF